MSSIVSDGEGSNSNSGIEAERSKQEKKKAKQEQKAAKIAKANAKLQEQQKKLQEQTSKRSSHEVEKRKASPREEEYVNTTIPGEKKDMRAPMLSSYDPKVVESSWYDWWNKKKFFHADNEEKTKESFVIVIPPPNVTGSLHLGHALSYSVQDAIVRWNRMCGKNTLWLPGTDHAGIATQVVVEKKLQKERNITRHDLGREKFIEEIWKWKQDYGWRIVNQLKRLGCSLDWDREVFTMDKKLSKAVTEAFIRMFNAGLIYRETRLVNWCCKLNTAISDIEVNHVALEGPTRMTIPNHGNKEYEFGLLYDIAYPIEGTSEELVISTTRPETMLADTAIAIHPDDERYRHLHSKFVVHPFHPHRKLPIILDSILVDKNFGTGAVKVTPAHDPNDFLCGKRHNLQFINMLNDDGTVNEEGAQFKGLKRFDAREEVIKALSERSLYRGKRSNPMTIAICSRSKDIIEPMMKPQWWVNCRAMADRAIQVVREGKLEILPATHKDTWYRWLENIHDWCISRQLWWGHRCPVYLVSVDGETKPDGSKNSDWVAAHSSEEALKLACEKHPNQSPSEVHVEQDPDVLDTWFSSGLFPFSVFDWPSTSDSLDYQAFYPTSLLETGHDILFFWVARMVMLALQLTDQLPFNQVLLHAMVRDAHGRKMSKSLGNVIDPIDMIQGISLENLHRKLYDGNLDEREIEKAKLGQQADFPKGIPECGTDATRFALCAYTTQGRDINLDINRVAAYRNFCNKLWNAVKFALTNLGSEFKPAAKQSTNTTDCSVWERWILSRLNQTIINCHRGFQVYDFFLVTSAIYSFWLYDLCDFYLESMKPVMQSTLQNEEIHRRRCSLRETLYTCLDCGLRLLHPFMPFVTEELFQRLARRPSEVSLESIVVASYPQAVPEWDAPSIEKDVKFVQDVIRSLRQMRANFNLTKEFPPTFVRIDPKERWNLLDIMKESIAFLSHCKPLELVSITPVGCAVEVIDESCQVYMMVKDLVDIPSEISKLEKKKERLQAEHEKLLKLSSSSNYAKVPETVRAENSAKMASLEQEIATIDGTIENYKKFL